jgi:pantoate--beta-alanine ligase
VTTTPVVIRQTAELQARADAVRCAGRRIALVPTMGALHEAHLSLVDEARRHADEVWVSIFVNPTQFNDPSDFEKYPQTFEADLALCAERGVDVVFAPTVDQLYPAGAQTWVEVEGLARPLCGASRPGHFTGVTTVVTKLFLAARPHVAVFGQKDFQQLAVIRRMTRDLGFGIEIVGAPTLREADGLAMSSRNVHLGPVAREEATALSRALAAAESAYAAGERSHSAILGLVHAALGDARQGKIDYAELRDPATLEPAPPVLEGDVLLALAVHFRPDEDGQGNEVRLIDNRVLREQLGARQSHDVSSDRHSTKA